ncbi:MAG TPA: hypothetical protein VN259_06895 [Xanthomonadales bacterium]|nr:hypothetical protein [Xanthomonadales bacterium]
MTDPDSSKFRVNARIDRVAEEQLRYVTEHTQMNVTEALRASIALMYDKVSREHARPADILKRAENFLAMGDSGRADGSENYKADLAKAYASKLDADR